jgi:pimeloyl-ACP methyl ester carboxylesterase
MTAWDAELCERLAAQGRHVIRLDSREAGKSARPGAPVAYSLHDLAAGVSQGGMTAQIVAVEHPDRVDGLVLISTTVLGDDDLPGPVEGLFSGGPEPPDWSDRAAVVRYLVELERPYGGDAFDEELMIAARTADQAEDLAMQLSHPFEVRPGPLVQARLLALDGFGHAAVPRRFWPGLLAAMPAPPPPAGE